MNTQRWMNRTFFTFLMTWGIVLPFWTGWMVHDKGITFSQASLIMSLGLVAQGGYLYEIEPRYAFLGMIVCTIPAMLLALVYRKMDYIRTGNYEF